MSRYMRFGFVLVLATAAAVLLPRIVASGEGVRDVTLVVRSMTYYLEGSDTPNPTLRFVPGEQVRLTLRNEDAGMMHDFNIPSWDVATKVLDGKGEDSVTFRVPGSNSTASYTCTPHSAMMTGSIVVE